MRKYMCMCTYAYICVYMRKYKYICDICTYTLIYSNVCVYIRIYDYIGVYVRYSAYISVSHVVCSCNVYVHVNICVHMRMLHRCVDTCTLITYISHVPYEWVMSHVSHVP